MIRRQRAKVEPFVYLLPYLVGTGIFVLYPIVYLVIVSFQEDYNLLTREFTDYGFENYSKVLSSADFHNALLNTSIYAAVVVPVTLVLSMLFAAVLVRIEFLKAFYQTAYFLPLVTSSVAIGMVWKYLYNADYGLFNFLLSLVGEPVNWLNNPKWNLLALIIFGTWNGLPFTILILTAALQSINTQLYTAAQIDGAGVIQRFFRITVPLMSSTLGFLFLLNLINSVKVFSELFPLFNGKPGAGYTLYTIVYYIYEQLSISVDLGMAAAASMLLLVVMIALAGVQVAIQRTRKVAV